MTSLLIHQAHCISTQNDNGIELQGGSIYIENGLIKDVLSAQEFLLRGQPLLNRADRVIDARHHLVTPGLINCHHHMVQSLTRAVKSVQNAELFSWLRGLYPLWAGLTPEMIQVSHQVAMAELLLSGCTTSSDHLYIYPNGVRLEDSIQAAKTMGLRLWGNPRAVSPQTMWWKKKRISYPSRSSSSRIGTMHSTAPCSKLLWRHAHLLA